MRDLCSNRSLIGVSVPVFGCAIPFFFRYMSVAAIEMRGKMEISIRKTQTKCEFKRKCDATLYSTETIRFIYMVGRNLRNQSRKDDKENGQPNSQKSTDAIKVLCLLNFSIQLHSRFGFCVCVSFYICCCCCC